MKFVKGGARAVPAQARNYGEQLIRRLDPRVLLFRDPDKLMIVLKQQRDRL